MVKAAGKQTQLLTPRGQGLSPLVIWSIDTREKQTSEGIRCTQTRPRGDSVQMSKRLTFTGLDKNHFDYKAKKTGLSYICTIS